MNTNHKQKLDKSFKWPLIFGGVILLMIIIGITAGNDDEESQPNATQSQISEPQNIQNELTPKQKEIKDYLIEIRNLSEECSRGDIHIIESSYEHSGIKLAKVSSAQVVYEVVLEKTQQLKVPIEGQYIQVNFLEATQTGLNGIKMMQLGYEKQPIDEDEIWQGLEIYGKAMLSLARMNEEILQIKEEFDLE